MIIELFGCSEYNQRNLTRFYSSLDMLIPPVTLNVGEMVVKIVELQVGLCSGVLDGLPHYILAGCCPYTSAKRTELPIFRPNEYFWKNHVREGEEKW